MKHYSLFIKTFLMLVMFLCGATTVWGNHHYSKVTVSTGDSGRGKVYVSNAAVEAPAYADTATATADSDDGTASSGNHTYYLYAEASEGNVFRYWLDESNTKVTASTVTVTATSTKKNDPTTKSYQAVFEPSMLTIKSSDMSLGTVAITKGESFNIGDQVTVTATRVRPFSGEMGATYSSKHLFEGWFDEDGNLVSESASYTFKIERVMVLTARFSFERTMTGPGFYRAVWLNRPAPKTEYLTLVGNYAPFTSIPLRRTSTEGVIELHTDPTDPGCIVKVTGKYTDLGNDYTGELVAIDKLVLEAQGMSTADILSKFNLQLRQAHNLGFLKVAATLSGSVGVLECYSHSNPDPVSLAITQNHDTNEVQDPNSYFDLQPIDEAHVNEYYWGVNASESMLFEGRYWTSMYTSYPYRVYDDIKVYYISSLDSANGEDYAVLEEIESGCVPAGTAVILACPGTTAAENRMIPSMEDYPAIENNLLCGEYQLNSKGNSVPKATFAGAKMKVLGVNDTGDIGFFKMAEGTTLKANKAWLDVSTLPQAAQKQLKIRRAGECGVEDVAVDAEDYPVKGIFDLYGRKVDSMVPGTIYVIDGKKVLYRN
ncbi:MAG: hypothetical protein UH625_06830 [Muribaculaceae bacterium]|nr:hypothetical protein [Muribaculaceae bacterium]